MPGTITAALFIEPGRIELDEKLIPVVGADDALLEITRIDELLPRLYAQS